MNRGDEQGARDENDRKVWHATSPADPERTVCGIWKSLFGQIVAKTTSDDHATCKNCRRRIAKREG